MPNMITEEQKTLSDYVKQVHLSLRKRSRQMGADNAWEEHLKNENVLQKYSLAMKKLAEDYWAVNNQGKSQKRLCRIEWIINYIICYFEKGILKKEIEKEDRKIKMFLMKELIEEKELILSRAFNFESLEKPYKLLDVGSCYNPFSKFNFLEVYAVDLYPATPDVKKCNFLNAEIDSCIKDNWFQDNSERFPANYFDIVVFSLFLEYLPSPKQRYLSFSKAYEILKTNGILIVVTPDSKHEGANALIMKNWKIAAAHIGFIRCSLEKLKYLYCMAFRKSASKNYAALLNNVKVNEVNPTEMFIIPQDSINYTIDDTTTFSREDGPVREMFDELPFA